MNGYLLSIEWAFLSSIILSVILTGPYMLVQYIKYGSVSKIRSLILFSLFLYLMCAYYLVIFPLPDPETVKNTTGPFTQLIPFNFIVDFIKDTPLNIRNVHTYFTALKDISFIQPAFNILITIPFGIYLGYYFKKSFGKTMLLSFLLSLFFELTQLSGLYGVYEHPYRLFDIDDLMLNTLGGIIGFFIYKNFLKFLPSKEKIDEKNLIKSKKVGYIRRFFAFIIDMIIVTVLNEIFKSVFRLENLGFVFWLLLFTYYLITQLLFRRTLGKALVHIKLEKIIKEDNFYLNFMLRYIILSIPFILVAIINLLVVSFSSYYNVIYTLFGFALALFLFLDFLYSFWHDKKLFYERFSKTENINTIKMKKVSEEK